MERAGLRRGGDGHIRLRGRGWRRSVPPIVTIVGTPSAGTAGGATSASRLPPARPPANGRPVHPGTGPSSACGGALEQPRRDRQVAAEIRERPIPAQQHREPSSRKPAASAATTARSAAPPSPHRERPARHDRARQVPEHRARPVRRRARRPARAARLRRRIHIRPGDPSGPWYSQPWRDSVRRYRWSNGWATPSSSRSSSSTASASGDGPGRPAVRRRSPRTRRGTMPDGSSRRPRDAGQPVEVQQRHARARSRSARTGRSRSAGRCPWRPPGHRRRRPAASRSSSPRPSPAPWSLGQHEQHRQVPQPFAHGRRGERDDSLVGSPGVSPTTNRSGSVAWRCA